MLGRQIEGIQDFFARRTISAHVDKKIDKEVENRTKKLILAGGVPMLYSNHQMHPDGLAWIVFCEYIRRLTAPLPKEYQLKGLSVLFATSMINGQQGEELKVSYNILIGGGKKMGLIPVTATRPEDAERYKMTRTQMYREIKPLFDNLAEYGIGFLPEGTVEGGRHPEGLGIERIHGMQLVRNDRLIEFRRLANRILNPLGKWIFYLPLALHGSYRLMESPKGEWSKPKLTSIGKASLLVGVTGLALRRIQATLLMPYTDEDIEKDRGVNWKEDVPKFNDYAMRRLKPGLPPQAWGVYRDKEDVAQAIELSISS